MTRTVETADKAKVGGTIHVFELAGLGKAPFRYLGMRENMWSPCPGVAAKPGGSCDLCGASIRWECRIASADGRQFVVGSECVYKTGDAGLRRLVDRDVARVKRAQRRASEARRLAAGWAMLRDLDQAAKDRISAMSHPQAWAAEKGLTRADWIWWMLTNAGTSGRLATFRWIKKIAS